MGPSREMRRGSASTFHALIQPQWKHRAPPTGRALPWTGTSKRQAELISKALGAGNTVKETVKREALWGWTDTDRSATWSREAVEEGPAEPTAHSGDTDPRCLMQPGA